VSGPYTLVFEHGQAVPVVVEISRRRTIVGSGSACDIAITDRFISRQHAAIEITDKSLLVRDLNSKNGTVINGTSLGAAPVPLQEGDTLTLAGGRVRARLVTAYETEALPVSPEPGSTPSSAEIDLHARQAIINGKRAPLELSERQFRLLECLWTSRGTVVLASALKRAGWEGERWAGISDSSLRTQISRLRVRLRKANLESIVIAYIRDQGYLLR
jgi:hypothetical protein